jgi:hypothetical protein
MPSDNLEEFFKQKIEAVQHTPPPGSNWQPEATWHKLQQTAIPPRKKERFWLPYAAAVLVFVLLSGLGWLYSPLTPEVPKPTAATSPRKALVPPFALPKITTGEINQSKIKETGRIAIAEQPKAKAAAGRKTMLPAEPPALPVVRPGTQQSQHVAQTSTLETEPEYAMTGKVVTDPVLEPTTLPATRAQPLKVTIVLGAGTSGKIINPTAAKNLSDKKRKNRFHINRPDPEPAGNEHLAATDSAAKSLKLQARIDL